MSAYRSMALRLGGLLLAAFLLSGTSRTLANQAPDTGFFALLDAAPLVVTATVAERTENPDLRIIIYELAVQQVLKGTTPAPNPVVVQDVVFPSDRPLLTDDTRWLVVLEPLPASSRYRSLPADRTYLRIRDGRRGVRSAEAAAAVQPYLAAAAESEEGRHRERISALIAALPSPLVGTDAVTALVADPSPARDLSEDQLGRLAAALGNPAMPPERRCALLDLTREKHLAPLLPAVRPLLAEPRLAPFARRVLAAFGEAPSPNELRADIEQPDPAARRAGLETAHSLPVAERLRLLSGVAEQGREYQTRADAIDALAREGRAAEPVLASLLRDPDRRIAARSATALAGVGGNDALAALSGTFEGGTYDAQVAAVFALREIGSQDALHILRAVRAAPPDPRLQKVIDLALGVNTHGH